AGPLGVARAARCIRQAAAGLQHAHEAGVVHRNVKPNHLITDRHGKVKVVGLGLALFEAEATFPCPGTVVGTADYLAPEQSLDSYAVDVRADVYALGATFYHCLTGQPPFAGGTVAQKLIWHQTRNPRPIREIRPEVPEALEAVVRKMLA